MFRMLTDGLPYKIDGSRKLYAMNHSRQRLTYEKPFCVTHAHVGHQARKIFLN